MGKTDDMQGQKVARGLKSRVAARANVMAHGFLSAFGLRMQLLLCNIKPLIVFGILYHMLGVAVIVPVITQGFKGIMSLTGFTILSSENIVSFLLDPNCLVFACVMLLVIGIYALLEICANLFVFECSRQKKKVALSAIVAFGVRNAVRCVHPKNFLILLIVLVMFPLVGMGASSSFVSAIPVPASIKLILSNSLKLKLLAVAFFFAALYLVCRWMFALNYFTLEQKSFYQSARRSANLVRGNRIGNFVSMLSVQVCIVLINALVVFLATNAISATVAFLDVSRLSGMAVLAALEAFFMGLVMVVASLSVSLSCLRVAALFYDAKERSEEPMPSEKMVSSARQASSSLVWMVGIGLVFVLAMGVFMMYFVLVSRDMAIESQALKGFLTESTTETKVCAMPKAVFNKPRNTLAAIREAAAKGADSCVVDVQLSKDNQVFLLGDSNFLTSYGVDAEAGELNYDEISRLTMQSPLDPQGEIQSPPLLIDALRLAKEQKIALLVNVDSIASKNGALEAVLTAVQEGKYESVCRVVSSKVEVLKRVKKQAPTVFCVFETEFVMGDLSAYPQVDAFAVGKVSVSTLTVNDAHRADRELYAWDIKKKKDLEDVMVSKVDLVSTDNLQDALALKEDGTSMSVFQQAVRALSGK